MNISTRAKLSLALDWFALILITSVALIFIYSAQVFQEQNRKAWANVFTTGGSLMLSLVSIHIGSRIQQEKDKRNENRGVRKKQVEGLRTYIDNISDIDAQLKRAEKYSNEGKENESYYIRLQVKEKLRGLQANYPSADRILDSDFGSRIQSAVELVVQLCDNILAQNASSEGLSNALQSARSEIQKYENIE